MIGNRESVVVAQCLTFLRLHRVFAWRNNTGAALAGKQLVRFGLKGSSDIIGVTNDGRFLAIECKREGGGVLSEWQQRFLNEVTRRGGVALVVHNTEELAQGLADGGVI